MPSSNLPPWIFRPTYGPVLHTKLGGPKRSNERTDQHDSVDIKLAPFFLCFESIDKGPTKLGGQGGNCPPTCFIKRPSITVCPPRFLDPPLSLQIT